MKIIYFLPLFGIEKQTVYFDKKENIHICDVIF